MSKDTKHIRNRDAWKARALAYERAIRLTLQANAHLADGDNCTLIELKRALRDNASGGTMDSLHAQADVDISGAAVSVKLFSRADTGPRRTKSVPKRKKRQIPPCIRYFRRLLPAGPLWAMPPQNTDSQNRHHIATC
jgi:hypothetical protein